MNKINIFLISGFLGSKADWDFLIDHLTSHLIALPKMIFSFEFHFFNLSSEPFQKYHSKDDVLLELNQSINLIKQNSAHSIYESTLNIFLGYSLGGRILLSLLEKYPQSLSDDLLVFISTHPGLTSDAQKQDRILSDTRWADQFLKRPIDEVLNLWNQQEVFFQTKKPKGQHNFDPQQLAWILKEFSLGYQNNLRPLIERNKNKLLWVVGERDKKFTNLAKSISNLENQSIMIKNAGHRTHLDGPQELAIAVHQFLLKSYSLIPVFKKMINSN